MECILEKITSIKEIYISSEEFCKVNAQSCDCLDLIIDTGEYMVSVEYFMDGDHWWMNLYEITEFKKDEYKYKVVMNGEVFKLEKINRDHDGLINALKFKYNDVFLFIFADEYNLILTKSKCDLLDEIGELCDEEIKLTIIYYR